MKWHQVSVVWHKDSGLDLILNSIRHNTLDVYSGKSLSLNVWVVLGAMLDTTTSQPIEDKGFYGCLSQVNLYNRNLSFLNEGPRIITSPQIYFSNVVLAWNEYILYRGVNTVAPSFAARGACTGNVLCMTGQDKTPPIPQNCPGDIIVHSNPKPAAVSWPEPSFIGSAATGGIKSNYRNGETFLWGKYTVTYEARDEADNAAFCTFDIYVQYDSCSQPRNPINGNQICENMYSPYHGCTIGCIDVITHTIDINTPNLYTCGPLGSWYPADRYQQLVYPSCGEIVEDAKKSLNIILTYPDMTTSYCNGIKNTLAQKTREAIETINIAYSGHVCRQANCADVVSTVSCGSNTFRLQDTSASTVTINIPTAEEKWINTENSEVFLAADVMTSYILESSLFDFTSFIPGGRLDPNGFSLSEENTCAGNYTAINGRCVYLTVLLMLVGDNLKRICFYLHLTVRCGPGNYFDTTTRTCLECPVGEYQNEYAQQSCKPCQDGTSTRSAGSSSQTQCKESCPMGKYFDTNADKCIECSIGFYQDKTRQFHCQPCASGQTTRENGSVSITACKDDCPSGKELLPTGGCVECATGSYRTQGVEIACNAGYKRVGTDSCMECLIGTYQPEKWQTTCLSCGGARYRTDQNGSVSQSQFFCESGYEVKNNTCEACSKGFYKDNSLDVYGTCRPCPNNKFTQNNASTSESDCTFYKCGPGYKSNVAGDDCVICPKGSYQPLSNQQSCEPCPTDQSTRQTGSTSSSQCDTYCEDGKERDSDGNCVECPIGFYKDNSVDLFMNCTACPDHYVTANPKSGSINLCTIRNCPPGSKRNADDTTCLGCPVGTFQNLPHQKDCQDCPHLQSTRRENSTAHTDCESYCPSGKEKLSGGTCQDCDQGYFKDNDVNKFSMCTLCGNGNITPDKATEKESQCTVANCTAGEKRDVNTNTCKACPKGYYQPDKWQTFCEQCPPLKTTVGTMATSVQQCILQCPAGYQDIGGVCTECPRGSYKVESAATTCTMCSNMMTTEGNGSISASDCVIPGCVPGYYLNRTVFPMGCRQCGYDTYQDEKWQETCKPCSAGKVTLDISSTMASHCVLDCSSGSEYNVTSTSCVPCIRGYYRNSSDRAQTMCQMCPTGYITESTGATSKAMCNILSNLSYEYHANQDMCNILGCTEHGTYSDTATATCKDCPIGTYSNEKWRTSCISCQTGYTTQFTKSNNSFACQRDCDAGTRLVGDSCLACRTGSYRNKTASWTCTSCPDGFTTLSTGATSIFQCTASPCTAGFKFVPGNGGTCVSCPPNTYQPTAGQFSCITCPNGDYTVSSGSTGIGQCLSHCSTGQNNCSSNAVCSEDASQGFTCSCIADYAGDGFSCVHQCDSGYCVTGVCSRTPLSCSCPDLYTGTRCEVRQDASKSASPNEAIIIGSSIGGAALLMTVIIIAVCCCVYARTTRPAEKYVSVEDYQLQPRVQANPLYSKPALMPPPSVHESFYDNRSFIGEAQNPELALDFQNGPSDPAFYTA
ncbi:proprotein convertase subtilisin/kexin type 5-like [Pecten maximus]|uniref:proprotein convertase subtilisin/kexin type 5-like n=1 Tax=Pecten maximus TaxID=6579 RepID=UPI0014590784|nr:proprotein convertase subtilisin/kexin type 5-like [Pecten maximus]